MRIYYILILGISLGSCFSSTDKQLLGRWKCYKETFSSTYESRIDTLLNKQIFEFKRDYTYEQRRWNMNGHGTWSLVKSKAANILTMISDQGFSDEYFVDKLSDKELVLVLIDTVSGETLARIFLRTI